MKYPLFLFILLSIACKKEKTVDHPFTQGKWVDLSYAFDDKTPFWPTSETFKLDTVFEGTTDKGYYYSAFAFSTSEHGGTHIDAPIHFSEGKKTVDQLPLESLTGPGIVIDVTDSVADYIDYQIQIEDFTRWEKQYGQIEDGTIVFIRTGIGKFWPDKKKYLGTDQRGLDAVRLLHFPGLDPKAAEWLVQNRNIRAIGIDTPSIDYGRSSEFMTHRILFEQNIPAFENMAYLDQLPDRGMYVVAFPMKIRGGSGAPLRVGAYVYQ